MVFWAISAPLGITQSTEKLNLVLNKVFGSLDFFLNPNGLFEEHVSFVCEG